ncbi:MAG: M48 family metallopeptidase [Candidatus Omnitrophota bacterium]
MDDFIKNAKAYSRSKYSLVIIETIISFLFFALFWYSGLSQFLAKKLSNLPVNIYIYTLLYMIILGVAYNLLTFWFDFSLSFRIEHRFGLSKQGIKSWFLDYSKKLIISSLISLVMVMVLYTFIRFFPSAWWFYVSLLYLIFTIVLAKLFPVLIIPLFYKMERITDEGLRLKIISLAKRAGVNVLDVYRIGLGAKTKKANAALCGLGKTKRVLLSDTLLENYTEEEISVTIAHELAHFKYKHIWKLTFINTLATFCQFYIIYIFLGYLVDKNIILYMHDLKAFPVLVMIFSICGFFISPFQNFISRRYEFQADRDALKVTSDATSFVNLMKKLSRQNLSDPKPSLLIKLFFYNHPPVSERVKIAQEYIG